MSDSNTKLKSNIKDILKTVLVLVVIACVSGALLGSINAVTYMSEEEILTQKLSSTYSCDAIIYLATTDEKGYEVMQGKLKTYNEAESLQKSLVIFPVKDGKVEDNTVIYRVYGAGDYDCSLLVVVKENKIVKVGIYGSSATPGIGNKAYKDTHMNQYQNIDLLEFAGTFKVEKKPAGNEIQAVAGATKSSEAVNNAMNKVLELHKLLFGEGK